MTGAAGGGLRVPNWGAFHVQKPLLYDQVVDRIAGDERGFG